MVSNDKSRAAFEAWARKQTRYPVENPDFGLDSVFERYKNFSVQGDWETWQASREVALSEAADALMKVDVGGLQKDQYLLHYTVQLLTTMKHYLESLK